MTPLSINPKSRMRKELVGRRFFLFLTSLTLAYPLLSFLGYRAQKKLKTIPIQHELKSGDYHIEPEFILFQGKDQPWAISRKCTHLGCTLQFREEKRILECPCHQSRFSDHGIVLNGPAKRNLASYHVDKIEENKTYLVTI